MAINILDMLKSQIGSQVASQIGKQFGTNESSAKAGVDAILPTILGGLLKQVAAPGGAEKLDKTIKDGGYDGGLLDNITGMLTGSSGNSAGDASGKGGDLVSSIFGDKLNMLLPLLSKITGLSAEKLQSIMAMVAPLVMSFLGKQQKVMGLDSSGLANMLMSQKDSIGAAVPPAISDSLGLASLGIKPAASPNNYTPPATTSNPWPARLGVAAILLAAVGYGAYRYIFAGIRPMGPEGNVLLEVDPAVLEQQEADRPLTSAPPAAPAGEPATEQQPVDAPEPAMAPAAEAEPATETTPAEEDAAESEASPVSGILKDLGTAAMGKLPMIDGVPDLQSFVGTLSNSLANVKDAETAKTALPDLESVDQKLGLLKESYAKLPDAVKTKLSGTITSLLPDLQGTVDKVLAMPGVSEILKPIIDQVMAKLTAMKS